MKGCVGWSSSSSRLPELRLGVNTTTGVGWRATLNSLRIYISLGNRLWFDGKGFVRSLNLEGPYRISICGVFEL